MKIQGKNLYPRNSNKKYHQLDDLDLLYELLKIKSIGQLSKELKVPSNSIRYRVFNYFPEEWINNIKKDKKYHKNKVR